MNFASILRSAFITKSTLFCSGSFLDGGVMRRFYFANFYCGSWLAFLADFMLTVQFFRHGCGMDLVRYQVL